jgi:hypothetical protein
MKKHPILTVVLINIIFAVLQTSFFSYLLGTKMNIDIIASVCFALVLLNSDDMSYFSALVGGLFIDLLGTGLIGITSVLLTVYVYLYKWLNTFYMRNIISKVLFSIVYFYILKLIALRVFVFDSQLLFSTILTVITGYILSFLLKGIVTSEQKINY